MPSPTPAPCTSFLPVYDTSLTIKPSFINSTIQVAS